MRHRNGVRIGARTLRVSATRRRRMYLAGEVVAVISCHQHRRTMPNDLAENMRDASAAQNRCSDMSRYRHEVRKRRAIVAAVSQSRNPRQRGSRRWSSARCRWLRCGGSRGRTRWLVTCNPYLAPLTSQPGTAVHATCHFCQLWIHPSH